VIVEETRLRLLLSQQCRTEGCTHPCIVRQTTRGWLSGIFRRKEERGKRKEERGRRKEEPKPDFSNNTVSLCHTYNADTAGLHWKAHLECAGGHTNTWEASDTVAPDARSTPVLNLLMTLFILLTGCRFTTVQVIGIINFARLEKTVLMDREEGIILKCIGLRVKESPEKVLR
jgi:hypothetical protein